MASFFKELEKINSRDCLIAKIILQGGKRVNEVLSLQVDKIDWEQCEITFMQSKTRKLQKETVITYSENIMRALRAYIGGRQGFQDSDIMRVTGHSTSEMVNAYDKTSRAENASKKVNLIS